MTQPRYIATVKSTGRRFAIDSNKTDAFFALITQLTGLARPMAEVVLHGGKGIDHQHYKFTAVKAKT